MHNVQTHMHAKPLGQTQVRADQGMAAVKHAKRVMQALIVGTLCKVLNSWMMSSMSKMNIAQ